LFIKKLDIETAIKRLIEHLCISIQAKRF